MHHELETLADPAAVAAAGAAFVAERARAAVAASGSFHFAVAAATRRGRCSPSWPRRRSPGTRSSSTRWTSGWLRPVTPTGTSPTSARR